MSPKQKQVKTGSSTRTVAASGSYATARFRSGMEEIVTTSALSQVNALVITKPGWGKSKTLYHMGNQMFPGQSLLLDCSPATQPEDIRGHLDYLKVMQGVYVRIVEGTPADQNICFVGLDEAPRLPDPAYDIMLPMLQRIDPNARQVVFVGTGNFFVKGTRTEAFYDRFGLNYVPVLRMDEKSLDEVVMGVDFEQRHYNVPDARDVDDVRNAPYGGRALRAINDFVRDLFGLMAGTPFEERINPRRLAQWREVLFRVGCYYASDNDFVTIPGAAISAMKYAMPVSSENEYLEWTKITGALADKVKTIVETVLAQAYEAFTNVKAARNANEKGAMMTQLAEVDDAATSQLEPFTDDPRASQAIDDIHMWFRLAAAGKELPTYEQA